MWAVRIVLCGGVASEPWRPRAKVRAHKVGKEVVVAKLSSCLDCYITDSLLYYQLDLYSEAGVNCKKNQPQAQKNTILTTRRLAVSRYLGGRLCPHDAGESRKAK